MPPRPLDRLRRLCLSLPEAHEVEAWGEPTFRVRNKLFAMFASAGNHHGAGNAAVWCKATKENQGWMVQASPDRYFVPPYVGVSGWVGVYLNSGTDWDELTRLLTDGYRAIAPKRVLAAMDASQEASRTLPSKKKSATAARATSPPKSLPTAKVRRKEKK